MIPTATQKIIQAKLLNQTKGLPNRLFMKCMKSTQIKYKFIYFTYRN